MTSLSSSASSSSASTPTASSNGTATTTAAAVAVATTTTSSTTGGTASNSGNQFYRLKVEDALSYLDQVKFQFERQPEVYNQFLDIMKEFKSQSIDTPGVISRVSNLFRGHTDLIEGFNTFLPPGYKIEVQSNDAVHYTAPNSTLSTLVQPINDTKPLSTVSATLVNLTQTANLVKAATNSTSESTKIDPVMIAPITINGNGANLKNLQNQSNSLSVKIIQTPTNITSQIPQQILKSNMPSSTPPPPSSQVQSQPPSLPSTTPQTASTANNAPQSQVEFGHAINYVNKIKSRFSNQPETYKSFLEILHTYQKQQKNIKEGIPHNSQNFLSESEVYEKVAKLFKNQEDLLIEFSQFLPDANQATKTSQQSQNSTQSNENMTFSNASFVQSCLQPSILNVPIPTVITSSLPIPTTSQTQSVAASSTTPNSSNKNNTTSSSTSVKQSQKVSGLTQPTTSASPISSSSNSSACSSNQKKIEPTNSTSLTNKTNTPNLTAIPVKRASAYQPLTNKKQKLNSSSTTNQSNSNSTTLASTTNKSGSVLTSSNLNNVDMTINKHGTLNEITFFERLKKALRTQQVYDNFLKCLALFNQDIVTHTELISLVEPFLGKFANLFKWFKEYVETKAINNISIPNDALSNAGMASPKHMTDYAPNKTNSLNSNRNRLFVPPGNNYSLEIDYMSCKQYGASYRDISSYPQPISSGQTELCKQVLNSIYVSFPLWSEDSTFVSSKKNQYEELIFRIEDERFELDVVLESNLSTIRVLENVLSKLNQMSSDEAAKFRLNDQLGGTSETIHIKAIQRVYGEKAKDFIDGLKKNPIVAVPLVLKRLKAKDEEWREAKKNLEKQWREQIERNYLKSLDHCAAPFKQNDQKHLKAKSLTNEIETIYHERLKSKEDESADAYPINEQNKRSLNTNTNSSNNLTQLERNPHLIIKYEEKPNPDEDSILEDAAALIIHHVKRQQSIQKEDKNKMKQIMKHFITDFFFVTRGCLSDDESEPIFSRQTSESINTENEEVTKKLRSQTNKTDESLNRKYMNEFIDSPEEMYRLFFVDDHWYLFFRYHHILCERLFKIYKHAVQIAEQEAVDSRNRDKSVAEALKLRNKSEIPPSEYYKTFLDIVRNLLDLNMEPTQYEDTLREMFGINAYIAFTLDKVVHNCVRQLQYLVQDETSSSVKSLYLDELKASSLPNANVSGCGGKVANMYSTNVNNAEMAYQKKAETLLSDQNCFQIISYKNTNRLTIELLDTQDDEEDENEMGEIEKWSEFIEKYSNNLQDSEERINDELKRKLLANPVFLTRNAHYLKFKNEKYETKTNASNNTNTTTDNTKTSETSSSTIKKEEEPKIEDSTPTKEAVKTNPYRPIIREDGRFMFVYRKNSIRNAKKSHQSVTKKMYDKFRKYTNKWLKTNSIPNDCIDDWLLGENYTNVKTVRVKENYIKKSPYHVYYKYKVETNTSVATSSSASNTGSNKRNNQVKNSDKKNTDSSNETASESSSSSSSNKKSTETEDKK